MRRVRCQAQTAHASTGPPFHLSARLTIFRILPNRPPQQLYPRVHSLRFATILLTRTMQSDTFESNYEAEREQSSDAGNIRSTPVVLQRHCRKTSTRRAITAASHRAIESWRQLSPTPPSHSISSRKLGCHRFPSPSKIVLHDCLPASPYPLCPTSRTGSRGLARS